MVTIAAQVAQTKRDIVLTIHDIPATGDLYVLEGSNSIPMLSTREALEYVAARKRELISKGFRLTDRGIETIQ